LDPFSSSAAAAAATGHRPVSELTENAFDALEENFFDSCARAIAPIARSYAKATSTIASSHAAIAAAAIRAFAPDTVANVADDSDATKAEQQQQQQQQQQNRELEHQRRAAASEASGAAGMALGNALESFGSDLAQCMRRTHLRVCADVSLGDVHSFGEMICSTGWDRDGEYIATAGISKCLRIFDMNAAADLGTAVHCPVAEMKTTSKLSSSVWNPYIKHMIASADYDGAIQMWDVNRGEMTYQLSEHKKRVWSLDFSTLDPTRLVSGSDDGTVRVWSISQRRSPMVIHSKANVCSVQFNPANANVVAFGSADYKTYVYDLR
jgi:protein suppressor of PHYA-105 1